MAELKAPARLALQDKHWRAIRLDVEKQLPMEACGLVAGLHGKTTAVFPITNVLASPVRFQMSAREQIKAMWQIEAHGWDLAAIYHSHPNGPPVPSRRDILEAAYPKAVQMIVSPLGSRFGARGFLIAGGMVQEIELQIPDFFPPG